MYSAAEGFALSAGQLRSVRRQLYRPKTLIRAARVFHCMEKRYEPAQTEMSQPPAVPRKGARVDTRHRMMTRLKLMRRLFPRVMVGGKERVALLLVHIGAGTENAIT